ncbi:uncharacterized protein V6R79_024952 [Siganus canaliculatus]
MAPVPVQSVDPGVGWRRGGTRRSRSSRFSSSNGQLEEEEEQQLKKKKKKKRRRKRRRRSQPGLHSSTARRGPARARASTRAHCPCVTQRMQEGAKIRSDKRRGRRGCGDPSLCRPPPLPPLFVIMIQFFSWDKVNEFWTGILSSTR